jgi:hypothetical protein
MGLRHSPRVVTDGLVFAFDRDNVKSYKGPSMQNLATTIVAVAQSGTGYNFTASTESVFIPTLGQITSQKLTGYNNYSAVSAICCPQLYYYVNGNGSITVTPSTVYTYSIVFKTTSGYTHPNFMYRYEYNGATYVTESGVYSDANRIHLGDGWYWAWGTFTTNASTNLIYLRGFYYNYGTADDNMYVAKVLLTPGTFTGLHPRYWPNTNATRANTNNIIDLTTTNTVVANNLTYAANGTFYFNGTNNSIVVAHSAAINTTSDMTIAAWINVTNYSSYRSICGKVAATSIPASYDYYLNSSSGNPTFVRGNSSSYGIVYAASAPTTNVWQHVAVTMAGSTVTHFLNSSNNGSGTITTNISDAGLELRIGSRYSNDIFMLGHIANLQIYNRALSAQEIRQNYIALKGRFGL